MSGTRLLHTMLRVADLPKSIAFYELLGMRVLRTSENTAYKYSLTFMGYGGEDAHAVLELTYNYGVSTYELGSAFGHIAVAVEDCAATCALFAAAGHTVARPAGPVAGGETIIAFLVDPTGYKVELIQRK